MEETLPRYVKIDITWYNELIRSKARYDCLIDSLIASKLKDYDIHIINESLLDYYSKLGSPKILEGE